MEIEIAGCILTLKDEPDVPPVTPFSRLLADSLAKKHCKIGIDFGCGSGVQGLLLLLRGAKIVYAVDCLENCIRAVTENAAWNRIPLVGGNGDSKIGLVPQWSCTLEGLANCGADLLVSNPPTMPSFAGVPKWADGGAIGRNVLDHIILNGPKCISPTGEIVIVHSSLCGLSLTTSMAEQAGLVVEILRDERVPFRPWYYESLPIFENLKLSYDCTWERDADGAFWEHVYVLSLRFTSNQEARRYKQ